MSISNNFLVFALGMLSLSALADDRVNNSLRVSANVIGSCNIADDITKFTVIDPYLISLPLDVNCIEGTDYTLHITDDPKELINYDFYKDDSAKNGTAPFDVNTINRTATGNTDVITIYGKEKTKVSSVPDEPIDLTITFKE